MDDSPTIPGPDVNATKNDWGAYSQQDIFQRIFDGVDNPTSGIVSFNPFLPAQP